MRVHIRQGYDLRLPGAPEQVIHPSANLLRVALLGTDYPDLRPSLAVSQGDQVGVGQVLFRDRARPAIAFVSSVNGKVAAIERTERRKLSALVLETNPKKKAAPGQSAPASNSEELRNTLLERGLWPAFLTRPFGRIPDPEAQADAIFVTATDYAPHAPDPRTVLEPMQETFQRGVKALAMLTDGPVYVCQSAGEELAPSSGPQIRNVVFEGPYPSGLAGTHVAHLHPVPNGRQVWTVGYQDVAAIGHLLETGQFMSERVISLAGPRASNPRLLRTVTGANILDLTEGEIVAGHNGTPAQLLSGSSLDGREATYLGRYHRQVSLVDCPVPRQLRGGWFGFDWFDRPDRRAPQPIIPRRVVEQILPFDILPIPLMRALSVADSTAAERLGCLDLVEEDMALLSFSCTSNADYGLLLRQVLDELAETL